MSITIRSASPPPAQLDIRSSSTVHVPLEIRGLATSRRRRMRLPSLGGWLARLGEASPRGWGFPENDNRVSWRIDGEMFREFGRRATSLGDARGDEGSGG